MYLETCSADIQKAKPIFNALSIMTKVNLYLINKHLLLENMRYFTENRRKMFSYEHTFAWWNR